MVKFSNEAEQIDSIRKIPDWTVRALDKDHAAPSDYIGELPRYQCKKRMGFLLLYKVKVPVSGQDTHDLAFPEIFGQHHDRLFWLNLKLTAIMKQIGFDQLVGIVPGHGVVPRAPVLSIGRVRWGSVDPICTTVPKHYAHGAPVFVSGYAASWASNRGLEVETHLGGSSS